MWTIADDGSLEFAAMQSTGPAPLRFTATEVDQVIAMLSIARAQMTPAIPMLEPTPTTKVKVAGSEGRWFIGPEPNAPHVAVALLHPGLGWVAVQLRRKAATEMLDALGAAVSQLVPGESPAGAQVSAGGTTRH